MELTIIMQLATMALTVFNEERKRYYNGRITALQEKIDLISNVAYPDRDMNAKGWLEREMDLLVKQIVLEGKND